MADHRRRATGTFGSGLRRHQGRATLASAGNRDGQTIQSNNRH
jgi:hypothetical protein